MGDGRTVGGVDPSDEWLDRIGGIRQWSRGGERAPHKPLLLLYVLGRLQRTGTSKVSYADAEPILTELLRNFGPPGRKTSPAYPFHHLQSDGIWTVDAPAASDLGSSPTQLRGSGATGQLPTRFEAALGKDARLVAIAARFLLDANFPESLHSDICAVVGLDLEAVEVRAARQRAASLRRRDPQFRDTVLVAYEYRCAMCSYDGRLGAEAVGLDAAHVRWWAFEGPDSIDNALCLCSFHHKLLDRGVVGIADDYTVSVSARFVGRGHTAEVLVLDLLGRPLQAPQRGQPLPGLDHVQWHRSQVFSGPARIPAT
ncbi:MAG TPA: HNH endonuclease [Acidimicrobiales bacterium]|nr:HNH endonuclease [Acidimicrobiales bacterium]